MKHFHCPVNGWDCPYFKTRVEINNTLEYCICTLDRPCDDGEGFGFMGEDCDPGDYAGENGI